MIISTGLGDDSSNVIDVSGGGNEPTISGITTILIGFGLFFVLSKMFGTSDKKTPTTRRSKPTSSTKKEDYKLEVDITGNGRWVTQAEGSIKELEKQAKVIKAKEGMKTRIV